MKKLFQKEEKSFLLGPRGRWRELKYALGVTMQFIKGFRALHFIGPCVTVFGSARFSEHHVYYKQAREVSAALSKLGFTIMTGGGPGIMEAANRGAKDVGGSSVGCNILLPQEQAANPYVDKSVTIEYFFVRKALLRKYSEAFVVMPGGFGTLDEFFETITLIQTQKTEPFPIVIMGKEYHKGLIAHLNTMVSNETISETDAKLVLFTDSILEAVKHIETFVDSKPKPKQKKEYEPIWLFGEKQ
jgi:uncharacterized protein (TIGR00730 family)